uniref:Uncharacterized protein n=1 Tax=Anguilla anguilla TaxID=7936 RepID=A0A0E9ST94_ANGAN
MIVCGLQSILRLSLLRQQVA